MQDPFILLDADHGAPKPVANDLGTALAYTARAPYRKTGNQDALLVAPVPNGLVLVVSDGMGGGASGDLASAAVVQQIAAALQTQPDRPVRDRVMDGIEQAHRDIQMLDVGAAATVAVAHVMQRPEGHLTVRTIHAGDSPVLMLDAQAELKLKTVDHSPVGFAVEAGLLAEPDAMHHHERHLVSNIVGLPSLRLVVGLPHTLAPGDTLLLGTDGLFDNLTTDEIAPLTLQADPAEAARSITRIAYQRMHVPLPGQPSKPDDCSFILFRAEAPA